MIYDILKIVKNEAARHLGGEAAVVLGNIAKVDESQQADLADKMVLTLLNSQEEPTLKNKSLIQKNKDNNTFTKEPTPAYLNLYIMLASNRSNYEKALQDISSIVAFFQNKSLFTEENTPDHNTDLTKFRFVVDLYPLAIEQLSYAWGVLGGKALPSALYKINVVKVQLDAPQEGGEPLIVTAKSTFKITEDKEDNEKVIVGNPPVTR